MENQNYQLKNFPVSANEINLRFAVLDLYQKLKKNEMFCDYYERCRNELIKDYLKLRQERDYYLCLLQNQIQRNDARFKKETENLNLETNGIIKSESNFNFEKEIDFSIQYENEESYEEIAKRLIKQFKEEMEELKKSSFSSNEEKIKAIINSKKEINLNDDDEVLSQITLIQKSDNILGKEFYEKNEQKYETQIKEMTIGVSSSSRDVGDFNEPDKELIYDDMIKERIQKGNFLIDFKDKNEIYKKNILSKGDENVENKNREEVKIQVESDLLENLHKNSSNSDLCQKFVKSTISDYETISKILLFQNEKLRRLNSKHMKNYFKKQLDQK